MDATEIDKALAYYRDLFAEAGAEQEKDLLKRLKSPQDAAKDLLGDKYIAYPHTHSFATGKRELRVLKDERGCREKRVWPLEIISLCKWPCIAALVKRCFTLFHLTLLAYTEKLGGSAGLWFVLPLLKLAWCLLILIWLTGHWDHLLVSFVCRITDRTKRMPSGGLG